MFDKHGINLALLAVWATGKGGNSGCTCVVTTLTTSVCVCVFIPSAVGLDPSRVLWGQEVCRNRRSKPPTTPPPPLPKMNKLRDDEASSTNPKHQMENQMGWRPGNDNERLKGFQ